MIGRMVRRLRYPTPMMRARRALGFCSYDWHRAAVTANLTAHADDGDRNIPLALCGRHVTEFVGAMTSVPHATEVEYDDGTVARWSTDPDLGEHDR